MEYWKALNVVSDCPFSLKHKCDASVFMILDRTSMVGVKRAVQTKKPPPEMERFQKPT